MKGIARLNAIDLSSDRLKQRMTSFPQNTIHVLRILRAADIAVGDYFERLLSPDRINGTEFHTLAVLSSCDASTSSPSELAELVGQTRANISRTLESLINLKYVSRSADQRDGRRRTVTVSPKGEAFLENCVVRLAPVLSRCLESFAKEEIEIFERLLRKMIAALDRGEQALMASARMHVDRSSATSSSARHSKKASARAAS